MNVTNQSSPHGVSLYRFQPYSDGLNIRAERIQRDALWFSTPKRLNDPMDVDHPMDDLMAEAGATGSGLKDLAKVMYGGALKRFPKELVNDDLQEAIHGWVGSDQDSDVLLTHFRERFQNLGVACFTPNWNCPPMWAHYAENWKGFALEYSVRQMPMASSSENNMFWQFWVNYASRISQTSLSELLLSPYEAAARILSTKTLPWSYENEWRLISLGGGDKALRVPVGMTLSGVILGPKSPCDQSKVLGKKCSDWSVPLRQVIVGMDRTLHLREARRECQ